MTPYSICLSSLFHLAQCPPGLTMLLEMVDFLPFLWLTTIVCVCVCITLSLSTDEYLGCFHILAIENNAQ